MKSHVGESYKLLRLHYTKILIHPMRGNIPYMFDIEVDTVIDLNLLKSSMALHRITCAFEREKQEAASNDHLSEPWSTLVKGGLEPYQPTQ